MKAAVIGAGRMGRRHVQVVQELGLDVLGVADANPEALQQTGASAVWRCATLCRREKIARSQA